MEKKNSVNIYRIFAAVTVVIIHICERLPGTVPGLSEKMCFYVDFFFLLSGFLMMRHINNASVSENSFEYMLHRAKPLFAPVCITNSACFLVFCINNQIKSIGGVLERLWHFRWEFLMLQCAGMIKDPQFNTDYLNGPAWYISALLIVSFFAYYLAVHHRRLFTRFLCPLASLLIYTFISQRYGNLNVGNDFSGPVQHSLMRGAAGICLGCTCYEIYKLLNESGRNLPKLMTYLDIAGWLGIPFSVIIALFSEDANTVFLLLPAAAALICGFTDKTPLSRFLNRLAPGVLSLLGEMSLYVYLCHFGIINLAFGALGALTPAAKTAISVAGTACLSPALYLINKKRKTLVPVTVICLSLILGSFIWAVI